MLIHSHTENLCHQLKLLRLQLPSSCSKRRCWPASWRTFFFGFPPREVSIPKSQKCSKEGEFQITAGFSIVNHINPKAKFRSSVLLCSTADEKDLEVAVTAYLSNLANHRALTFPFVMVWKGIHTYPLVILHNYWKWIFPWKIVIFQFAMLVITGGYLGLISITRPGAQPPSTTRLCRCFNLCHV